MTKKKQPVVWWTDKMLDQLRAMADARTPWGDIAASMGLEKETVINAAKRHGIRNNNKCLVNVNADEASRRRVAGYMAKKKNRGFVAVRDEWPPTRPDPWPKHVRFDGRPVAP
jgi:hypothetical protein